MPDERNSPVPLPQHAQPQRVPGGPAGQRSGLPPAAKKAQGDEFPFSVSVAEVYDGPLDLLLDLIRKQDIDIYDIPIAKITAQYLVYVERIKHLDVDVAAEFIYMASLLIQIKSRMLLPKDPDATAGEDDPRSELVNRLLEHERFKTAAQMLSQKQQIEDAVLTNPALKQFQNDEGTEPELTADVIDLVKTFQKILERAKTRPVYKLDEDSITVGQMIEYVRQRLMLEDRPLRLRQLLRNVHTRQGLVCVFLAILELIRLQAVLARQDKVFGDIVLKKHTNFDQLPGQSAGFTDDWK
jgi:segregation and condensation protein A